MSKTNFPNVVFIIFFLILLNAYGQPEIIPFDSERWDKQGAEIVEFLDRNCLIGTAYLNDVEFENGIIEVDIAVTGQKIRAYPGIVFRIQSPGNYERIYVRPHRASLYPDALQYTPAFNGIDGWQLYNGEGFTAALDMPDNQWVHFKFEISGDQAYVYMDDSENPVLKIYYLQHGVSKGGLGLMGQRDRTAYFSNFIYQSSPSLKLPVVQKCTQQPGIFQNWYLSQPFPYNSVDIEQHPEEQNLGEITWQKIKSDPLGLVDVSRYYGRTGREPACVIAKTTIRADQAKQMQMMFGYSDLVTLFLNGQLLFYGNSLYQGRDPSFLGIIGYNDAVYLPLQKGDNELLLWIVEAFGGWGFMAKDGNAVFEHPALQHIWKIEKSLKMPESVAYDINTNAIYVSNFNRYSPPGQQFISKLTPEGKILDLKWVDGLMFPTGMIVFKDKLYVVERRNVVEIDIETGSIQNRYPLSEPGFANDITVTADGILYISDSGKQSIYKLEGEKCGRWLESDELSNINGLYVDGNRLLAGVSSDHSLKSIDLDSREINTIVRFGEGIMDGIKRDQDGNILISHYEGRIYRITPTGEIINLIYNPGSRCADFEYIADTGLLVIPTLEDNKLIAYKLRD
jgi:hypothetical protein